MIEIIREKSYETKSRHFLEYEWVGREGSGFRFDCDENGFINSSELSECALENFVLCMTSDAVVYLGIEFEEWTVVHHPIGKCYCGDTVMLDGFTNTCDTCERDYSIGGHLLAPRHLWGEETGETEADILGVDY